MYCYVGCAGDNCDVIWYNISYMGFISPTTQNGYIPRVLLYELLSFSEKNTQNTAG